MIQIVILKINKKKKKKKKKIKFLEKKFFLKEQ